MYWVRLVWMEELAVEKGARSAWRRLDELLCDLPLLCVVSSKTIGSLSQPPVDRRLIPKRDGRELASLRDSQSQIYLSVVCPVCTSSLFYSIKCVELLMYHMGGLQGIKQIYNLHRRAQASSYKCRDCASGQQTCKSWELPCLV